MRFAVKSLNITHLLSRFEWVAEPHITHVCNTAQFVWPDPGREVDEPHPAEGIAYLTWPVKPC